MNNQREMQIKSEMQWLEQKIYETQAKVYRKPRLQKYIDNLTHQLKHREYELLLIKENIQTK